MSRTRRSPGLPTPDQLVTLAAWLERPTPAHMLAGVCEPAIKWLSMPEEHDYQAADDHLRLVLSPRHADHAVRGLRHARQTRA